jgi:hypothetical protein
MIMVWGKCNIIWFEYPELRDWGSTLPNEISDSSQGLFLPTSPFPLPAPYDRGYDAPFDGLR